MVKMIWIVLMSTLIGCDETKVNSTDAPAKKSKTACANLVGGAKTTSFPAAGVIATPVESNKFYTCSATFIGHNTMITAGHCISRAAPETVRYLGNADFTISEIGQKFTAGIKATKVFHHGSAYIDIDMNLADEKIRTKDVAIIMFPDETAPEFIPVGDTRPATGSTVKLVGYGNTAFGSTAAEDKVRRVGTNTTEDFTNRGTNMIAVSAPTGSITATDALAAPGDSGSGAFFNDKLIGILSNAGTLPGSIGFTLLADVNTADNRALMQTAVAGGAVLGPKPAPPSPTSTPSPENPDPTPPSDPSPEPELPDSDEDGDLSIMLPNEDLIIDADAVQKKTKKTTTDKEDSDSSDDRC
jgi:hypothetical protein